jgi:hypothetical protein
MASIELFTAPLVAKAVVFQGTNNIGPVLTFTLPRVLLIPTKGLELVSDKYGDMTFDGMLLVDVTTGKFGTVDVEGDLSSPNTGNYVIGGGTMTVDGSTMGNVTNVVLTPDTKTVPHYTYAFGEKMMDFVSINERGGKLSFTVDEWTYANLKLYLMGT